MNKKCFSFLVVIFSVILNFSFSSAQDVQVKNIGFTVSEDTVFISYDLKGDSSETYNIKLYIVSFSGKFEKYEVDSNKVYGDIGFGKYVGTDRKIYWSLTPEEQDKIDPIDINFEIIPEDLSGGLPWWTYPGVVTIGAVIWLITNSGDDEVIIATPGFGTPPLRPDH